MTTSRCPICGNSSFLCSDLSSPLRSVPEVRQAFKDYGVQITDWAQRHLISRASVYQVLYEKHRSYRGTAHAIAVLLRLKNGDLTEFFASRASSASSAAVSQQ